MKFREIPQFISDGSYQVDVQMEYLIELIDRWVREGGLQLCPDFQRGHVWTENQQIKFLEFIFQGGKTGRVLYFNDPHWHGAHNGEGYSDFVCVDGLQRITAIQRFLKDEIRVFGLLYSEFEGKTDLIRHSMVVNVNDLKTKKEVLQWYIQMNAGGTPHTPDEIQRVQDLMDKCYEYHSQSPAEETPQIKGKKKSKARGQSR